MIFIPTFDLGLLRVKFFGLFLLLFLTAFIFPNATALATNLEATEQVGSNTSILYTTTTSSSDTTSDTGISDTDRIIIEEAIRSTSEEIKRVDKIIKEFVFITSSESQTVVMTPTVSTTLAPNTGGPGIDMGEITGIDNINEIIAGERTEEDTAEIIEMIEKQIEELEKFEKSVSASENIMVAAPPILMSDRAKIIDEVIDVIVEMDRIEKLIREGRTDEYSSIITSDDMLEAEITRVAAKIEVAQILVQKTQLSGSFLVAGSVAQEPISEEEKLRRELAEIDNQIKLVEEQIEATEDEGEMEMEMEDEGEMEMEDEGEMEMEDEGEMEMEDEGEGTDTETETETAETKKGIFASIFGAIKSLFRYIANIFR